MDEAMNSDHTTLTADVVSAFVSHNAVRAADLPDLIASVHGALQGLKAPQQAEPEKREPPVSIKRSITPDFLISLEDGRRDKSHRLCRSGRKVADAHSGVSAFHACSPRDTLLTTQGRTGHGQGRTARQ